MEHRGADREQPQDDLGALLDRTPEGASIAAPARPVAEVKPPSMRPRELRRERNRLEQTRERALRDLGGLVVEMAKRERMRVDLLADRAAIILGLSDQLGALDDALGPLPDESADAGRTETPDAS